MINLGIIKELLEKVQMSQDISIDDICSIVYHIDFFEYGNNPIIMKHIDIEFEYGEYYETHEGDKLYDYIYKLCNLDKIKTSDNTEKILYEK